VTDGNRNDLRIEHNGRLLALVVPAGPSPDCTHFLTETNLPFQAGFVVYPKGGEVIAHIHRPLSRSLSTTTEVLIVREGSCVLDLFGEDRTFVVSRQLGLGDIVLLYAGGHRIRMPDGPCVLFEIKQGPYTGVDEKERFSP